MKPRIRGMKATDIPAVVRLADKLVGQGYYTEATVAEMLTRSTQRGVLCSHVAVHNQQLVGFRFSLPPGRWQHGRGQSLSPHLWPYSLAESGYFQTAYVDDSARRQGVGSRMATAAMASLQQLGARGVVTHCWKESPGNSSFSYLSHLGFQPIVEIPDYWIDVDYTCVRDGYPCRCTAIEMYLRIENPSPGGDA